MNESFDWNIDERATWPPPQRPRPPFGPTGIEVIRSCALRACFEVSRGYERRMAFSGRIGTAFHQTLESLADDPPPGQSVDAVVDEAIRRFEAALATQEAEAAGHPREHHLPRQEERLRQAREALIVFARGLLPHATVAACAAAAAGRMIEVEQLVQTRDGLFRGRIDRVERTAHGTRLVDFKSALRADLPERYVTQLQLYALLWYETRGEWATQGEVVYPLTGARHLVPVEPAICQQVGNEARALVDRLCQTRDASNLASPGDVCKVCEFRPWCRSFWDWQASIENESVALEYSSLGVEGTLRVLELRGGVWRIGIAWRSCEVQMVAPKERLPQLHHAFVGARVRLLDVHLHGMRRRPTASISGQTELFLLEDPC